MIQPAVSVVMATYNHAPYVAEAIESVLQQRGIGFEFLIGDDGSVDSTPRVVESIRDPRIRFYFHPINRGACTVTNELIKQATGEFIALINSDDRWNTPDKLAFQLDIMMKNPELGACFGKARFIDKRGLLLKSNQQPLGTVFNQANRSQGRWLRYFFERGNCICHPTMLIRRKCFDELGTYNNNFRQLPDYDMWIRLVKKYPIYITEHELVDFRILPSENTSSQTIANSVRIMNEHYLIAENFFDEVSIEQFADGFADLLRFPDVPSVLHADIEKNLLLLSSRAFKPAYSLIGLLKLHHMLASRPHQKILAEDYGINELWLQERMAEIDVLRPKYIARISQSRRWFNWVRQQIAALTR